MTRTMVVAIWVAVLLIGSAVGAEEKPGPTREPKAAAEHFLGGVRDGKIASAYDALMIGSPILEQAPQYMLLKGQTESQMPLFGKALDYEFLQQREVGKSILILKYVLRYEKDGVTWTFVFYRPRDQWLVTAIKYVPSVQYVAE